MTDAEREAQLYERLDNPEYVKGRDFLGIGIALLRRLLDEARAELALVRRERNDAQEILLRRNAEIARLTAPPGASAMERAEKRAIEELAAFAADNFL